MAPINNSYELHVALGLTSNDLSLFTFSFYKHVLFYMFHVHSGLYLTSCVDSI